MESAILVVKGFIIGIAKIIPGISGAMLAMSLGLYERCLYAITSFFSHFFQNFKLLFLVGLGVFLAIVLGSKMIAFVLINYYLPTMLLFIGMIIGGTRELFSKLNKCAFTNKNIYSFIGSFLIVLFLYIFKNNNILLINLHYQTFTYFILGLIDAFTMVIPGISGTSIFMLLGIYEVLLSMIVSLDSIAGIVGSINILLPFVAGLISGGISMSFIMVYLLKYHEALTYFGILGFQMSAIIIILLQTFQINYSVFEIIFGLFFLLVGLKITCKHTIY